MEKGLPIGCAPGINVSLVLLPEECASLSPRRFPVTKLKLKLLKAVVGRVLSRRLAKADAGVPRPAAEPVARAAAV